MANCCKFLRILNVIKYSGTPSIITYIDLNSQLLVPFFYLTLINCSYFFNWICLTIHILILFTFTILRWLFVFSILPLNKIFIEKNVSETISAPTFTYTSFSFAPSSFFEMFSFTKTYFKRCMVKQFGK